MEKQFWSNIRTKVLFFKKSLSFCLFRACSNSLAAAHYVISAITYKFIFDLSVRIDYFFNTHVNWLDGVCR